MRECTVPPGPIALLRAMPAVFVLIWSTGFIVARYGMPHAPPMKFLACAMRFSVRPSWSGPGWRARLAARPARSWRTWRSPAS